MERKTQGTTTYGKSGTERQLEGSEGQFEAKVCTTDDLMLTEGKEDEMLGRIQKKLGMERVKIRAEIESLQINSVAQSGS